ncbi:O-antigen ligase family protein [Paraburkholderia phenazinium]|uniref:O-antigen ligase-like membrane protein n=1 Tax=Paraburkholderia phenazinium TaxID=60549 RepID=A0A1G7QEN3_9BURK|nr:O-antigen ligase family protein [Paraburkholderia phenazinium]SDF96060.1 hypothetical protein SAMN05216466_101699 [Paraburkholderia phenazinium]
MDLSLAGGIIIGLGVLALLLPYQWAIYVMVASTLFGATEAVAFGGIGVLPASLFMVFFIARSIVREDSRAIWASIRIGSPGFWLLLLVGYGCVSAMVFPRVLSDSTFVYAIDRSATASATTQLTLQPLGPVSGNLSQSVYLAGECFLYIAASMTLWRRGASRTIADAFLFLAVLNVMAASIDLLSGAAGIDLLDAIKTAQYTIMDDATIGGVRRISGTFSESSAFAGFSLPLFAFTANLWLLGYRRKLCGLLAALTAGFVLLSTSSTGYVGLAAYLIVFMVSRSGSIVRASRARKFQVIAIASLLMVLVAGVLVAIDSPVVTTVSDVIDRTLTNKMDSDSGIERSAWNLQALVNFVDTFGLGVGLGSARASSFIAVTLGNLGLPGAVLFGLFFYRIIDRRARASTWASDRIVSFAAAQAVCASLIGATLSGTVVDLGPCTYLLAAVAFGTLDVRRAPVLTRVKHLGAGSRAMDGRGAAS